MKLLKDILEHIDALNVRGNTEIEVTGIAYDSRKIESGNIFVCIEGFKTDGHQYLDIAVANGAKALIIQKDVVCPVGITVIRVENSRLALAQAANAFYDFPAQKLDIVGVTGTNGKTTTTYLLSDVLKYTGKKTGVIGTIHNMVGDKIIPSEHTTPESSDLQKLFTTMNAEAVTDVAMEVSSHALSLERTATIDFKGAIFTNLTQDHLDFHNNMEDYFKAKTMLFTAYQHPKKINVINIDDKYGKILLGLTVGKKVTYSINNIEADFRAVDIKLLQNGIEYTVKYLQNQLPLKLKLLGEFNVYNSLAVVAYAITSGISPEVVKQALENANGVPGRFEIVDLGQPFTVAVDYAHTPDSLENILTSARKFASGNIIAVFGCGGDRDRTKRPQMGEIAARLSDKVIVTSDNPRSEEPSAIINDIMEGISSSAKAYVHIEADRRKAMEIAINIAKSGDIVIIAGKGHETYQIIKDKVLHFDDREEAKVLLKGMGYEN